MRISGCLSRPRIRIGGVAAALAALGAAALMAPANAHARPAQNGQLAVAASSDRPSSLVTDSRPAPMDVGDSVDFGWQSGVAHQSAYEIRVGHARTGGPAGVWDSGKVESGDSTAIRYTGPDLDHAQRYGWSVRIWDEHGRPSAWSRTAVFGTAPGQEWGTSTPIWSAAPSANDWTDYRLDFALTVTRTALGVRFRSPDANNGYMWQFRAAEASDGNSLKPHVQTGGTYRAEPTVALDPVDLRLGTTHQVSIEAVGSTITTSVDGTVVDTRRDTTFDHGGIGFRTGGSETGVVDDIKVTSLATGDKGKVLYSNNFDTGQRFPCGTVENQALTIGTSTNCLSTNTSNNWALLRRDFSLQQDKHVAWATAFATGSSFDGSKQYVYKLFLDGKFVGLGPTESLGNETRYDGYDVSGLLRQGERHTLSAIAYADKDQRFQAYLVVHYTDGTVQTLGTGPEWKTLSGADIWTSSAGIGTGYWNAPREDITMSNYPEGFQEPGYDDSSWSAAVVKRAFDDLEPTPFGKVEEQLRAPMRIVDKGNGDYFVDFGQTWQGGVHLTLTGQAGRQVTLQYGEELSAPETARWQMRTGNTYQDVVTLRDGTQTVDTWGMRVFRYMNILNSPVPITAKNLQALALVYPFDESAAQLTSSDPNLVAVWQLSKNTVESTNQNLYTDSWTRERGPYEADDYIRQLSSFYLDPDPTLGLYSMDYWKNHATWPTEWPMYVISSVYDAWQRTGSTQQLENMYEALVDKLLTEHFNPDTGTIDDSDAIVDWPASQRDGYVFAERNTILNALSYSNYVDMSAMARALGKTGDAAQFDRLAATLRNSLNTKFYNAAKGAYDDGLGADMQPTGHFAIQASAFPTAFGVPDSAAQYGAVGRYLASRGMACSVYCSGFLLQALYNAGYPQAALDLLTSTSKNSWMHMIEQGAGATAEAWDPSEKSNETWSHAWATAPAYVVPRDMYGIAPTSPGYSTFTIAPRPGDQTYGSITFPSVKGTIGAAFHRHDGRTDLGVLVPGNSVSTVTVPADATATRVYVDGRPQDATRTDSGLAVQVGVGCHVLSTAPGLDARGDNLLTGICGEDHAAGTAPVGVLSSTGAATDTGIPATVTFDQQIDKLSASDIRVSNGSVTGVEPTPATTGGDSCTADGDRAAGHVGTGALSLCGDQEYVRLPSGIVSGLHDFTVSAWVKPAQNSTWSRVFDFGSGTNVNMFLTLNSGSNLRFAITTGGSGGEQQIDGTGTLPLDTWSHVAVTRSGATGTLYVDGKPVGSNANMTLSPADLGTTSQNWIGKSQWPDPLFAGSIDDFQVYGRALSEAEVAALASGQQGAGDVASYRFDESGGPTAVDSSGNGRDASIVSTAPRPAPPLPTSWSFTVKPDHPGPVAVSIPGGQLHGTTGEANLAIGPIYLRAPAAGRTR